MSQGAEAFVSSGSLCAFLFSDYFLLYRYQVWIFCQVHFASSHCAEINFYASNIGSDICLVLTLLEEIFIAEMIYY